MNGLKLNAKNKKYLFVRESHFVVGFVGAVHDALPHLVGPVRQPVPTLRQGGVLNPGRQVMLQAGA